MYSIVEKKKITGCRFDFTTFAILTLQFPIVSFDMPTLTLNQLDDSYILVELLVEWPARQLEIR